MNRIHSSHLHRPHSSGLDEDAVKGALGPHSTILTPYFPTNSSYQACADAYATVCLSVEGHDWIIG